MRQPRKTADAAMTSVESRFDGRQGERPTVGCFKGEFTGFLGQLVVRYHTIDKTKVQGLGSGQLLIAIPHFFGLFLTDKVFQVPGAVAGIKRPHHGAHLAKNRAPLRNGHIANHLQHVTATDGKSVDARDYWLLQPVDGFIHVQGGQNSRIQLCVLHAGLATTDAKEPVPGPRQHDNQYDNAIDVVVREGRGSCSLLQRCLGIGYGRASRMIDWMAEDGIVGEYNGAQAREVLYSPEQWEDAKAERDVG